MRTDYNGVGKIQYIIASMGLVTINTEYTEEVAIEVMVPVSVEKEFVDKIIDGTNGRGIVEKGNEVFYAVVDGNVEIL